MDNQSLSNVLNILRLLRDANPNQSAIDLIRGWAGKDVSQSAVLKAAAYLSEQTTEAVVVISNSTLPDEVKKGLLETLQGVEKAFSLTGLPGTPRTHVKHVTGSISTLGMLLTVAQVEAEQTSPQEAVDLAKEVEDLVQQFDNGALDPVVRAVARQHLQTLATMLRHIHIFGLEAALTTYFELLATLRRAEASASDKSKAASKPLSEKVKSWSENFKSIDAVCNAGGRMIGRAKTVGGLISYFGP